MKTAAIVVLMTGVVASSSNFFTGKPFGGSHLGFGGYSSKPFSSLRLGSIYSPAGGLGLAGSHQGSSGYSDNDGYGAGLEGHGHHYKHEKKEYGQIVINDKFDAYSQKLHPRDGSNGYQFMSATFDDEEIRFDRANLKQNKDHVQITALPHTRDGEKGNYGVLDRVEYWITNNDALNDTLTPSMYGGSSHRFRASTQVHGVRKHLYPKALVTNPDSDYRLATNLYSIADLNAEIYAAIGLTNEAAWLFYVKNTGEGRFFQTKKIGYRSPYDIHDMRIDWDKQANSFTWFLDGYKVAHTDHIGLPSGQFRHMVDYADEDYNEVYPEVMRPVVNSVQFSDHVDPNNPASDTHLVAIEEDDTYSEDAVFYNLDNDYTLRKFGQGTVSQLYSLKSIVFNNKPHH